MRIGLSSQDITQAEIDAVVAVLKSPNLSLGPIGPEFESRFSDYIGRKHAMAVNSGTSGLHLCMLAMGIGPGDEVITTPFSFVATTNIILMAGATPVFVDIDPETYNLDIEQVKEKIGPKTKAIVPVEVFGNPQGLDAIWDLAQERKLLCIEDSCEALGSIVNGRKVGTLGHASVFAFYPNKQMTTGEGGIILTDDDTIADICRSLRNQGRATDGGWLAHVRLGYNYRLSDINSALGIEQIKRIEEFVAKRSQVAEMYQAALAEEARLCVPREPDGCRMSWFVFVIRLVDSFSREQRDRVIQYLRDAGIGSSNYFVPIHYQPFIIDLLGDQRGAFPVTERVGDRTLALPFHNNLSREEVQEVVKTLKQALDTVS